jgi:hypothetical protein
MLRRVNIVRALADPAAFFADPEEIVNHPNLSFEEKRELLHRWAFDAYRIEVVAAEAPRRYEHSRLDEVIDALIALEEAQPSQDRNIALIARRRLRALPALRQLGPRVLVAK